MPTRRHWIAHATQSLAALALAPALARAAAPASVSHLCSVGAASLRVAPGYTVHFMILYEGRNQVVLSLPSCTQSIVIPSHQSFNQVALGTPLNIVMTCRLPTGQSFGSSDAVKFTSSQLCGLLDPVSKTQVVRFVLNASLKQVGPDSATPSRTLALAFQQA